MLWCIAILIVLPYASCISASRRFLDLLLRRKTASTTNSNTQKMVEKAIPIAACFDIPFLPESREEHRIKLDRNVLLADSTKYVL